MNWLSLALAYSALAAFALAMEAHHRAVFARAPSPRGRRLARIFGAGLLVASTATAASASASGLGGGLAFVAVAVAVAGFGLSLVLTLRPGLWALPAILFSIVGIATVWR